MINLGGGAVEGAEADDASIFSDVGGPTIMSRGRSSMLALTLSRISEEKENGAMTGSRIESAFRVSRRLFVA